MAWPDQPVWDEAHRIDPFAEQRAIAAAHARAHPCQHRDAGGWLFRLYMRHGFGRTEYRCTYCGLHRVVPRDE
ncbi:hypothetical protein CKO44_15975 [Rubrivivax gelatinosus]|nr:hypothetical protein [Rubrivivax gelatinosus]MBZ8143777.1 hypothetical protein [Rubrivivax gelatinosus]